MCAIAIITDTDSSLSPDLAGRYHIGLTPINIHFGEETFRAVFDIDDAALFARVDREGRLPTTSAPSPGQFQAAFASALDEGADAVVCICVSSEISATYQAATTARDLMPDRDIVVIDSRTVSMAQGFMALAAAEAALRGALLSEVVAAARSAGERSFLFGALATLKYLAMSGRVGHVAAGFGNLLNVKPIVTMTDGKLEMLEKVRSRQRSLDRLLQLTRSATHDGIPDQLAIVHVNAREDAEAFQRELCTSLTCPGTVLIEEFTPGLSIHTGAGLIGVAGVRL
jgi:DegV family protein with EDD domain